MMRELADNILDIAENSVAAGATLLKITVDISHADGLISLTFDDNGKGMSPEFLKTVAEPFTTTRKTRKVGLGLPFLKQTAVMTGGSFDIRSELGKGTVVFASFGLDNIDRPPMGDVSGTCFSLVHMNAHMDFLITYRVDGQEFVLDTAQIKRMIAPLAIDDPAISSWISDYIKENITTLHGGAQFS